MLALMLILRVNGLGLVTNRKVGASIESLGPEVVTIYLSW